ncbi:MAG: hypothetical protein NTV43_14825 [Methylococcales bacterium]|nr:hypothetical protein [Methylococcales bacterium]
MNTRLVSKWAALLILCLALQPVNAGSKKTGKVLSCQLGAGQSVTLIREHRIADTAVYYLQLANDRTFLFANNEDESRGRKVAAACLGDKKQLLLVSGEFSSNYLQGIVLRYNPQTKQTERLDFAERARPSHIYLSGQQMSVVIPNQGHETDKPFLLYRYVSGVGATDEGVGIDALPPKDQQLIIRVGKTALIR